MAKERLWKILVCCALAVGTALLYLPVLHFDYINYDDPLYIINNQHIRTLSWQSLQWSFQNNYASLWHPLTWVSHILDFHFYGLMHPGGHHATNVVLHIFNSTLLFVILNRMAKALWPSAMVAALFAWHPLHVESVAWISERKDVLSAFFWMLTMWAYIRYTEQAKKPGLGGKVFYGLALLFFALGLMSKPMLVTLPFVLLLLDWWPLRRFSLARNASQAASTKEDSSVAQSLPSAQVLSAEVDHGGRSCWSLVLEKIPFLILSILACIMTMRAASHAMNTWADYPMRPRIINAAVTYLRYVEKMIWPKGLVIVYPPGWSHQEVIMAGLFLVIFSVTSIRLWKDRPFWLVGWLWYLGILVPVIGLVAVGTPPLADHNTYLPSIGIFMIVCWEAGDIVSPWKNGRAILGVLGAAILGACLAQSSRQLQYWKNPVALFTHNLEVTPDNFAAHTDYAAFLRDNHQWEQARAECETALHLYPDYAMAHNVLGGVFIGEGQFEKADAELRASLRLDPSLVGTRLTLGGVALARKLPAEAVLQFGSFLTFDPSDPGAHCGLGQALAMQGKLEESRVQYAEALRLAPHYPDAHFHLAVLMASQHRIAEAVAEYRAAIQFEPEFRDALNNLAWILATDPHPENRNGAEAVQLAAQACARTGNKSPFFLGTLAAAYAEAGRFDDAIAAAENAAGLAVRAGNQSLADRNLELLTLYRSHQPYHEK